MSTSPHAVTRLRAEYDDPTPWVGTDRPRLSWQSVTDAHPWHQSAAEIRVTTAAGTQQARVDGAASVLLDWPFAPLTSREPAQVTVRTAGPDGAWSRWSEPLTVRSALLGEAGWQARPVQHAGGDGPALLRTEVTLDRPVRAATLYAAAQGVFQVVLNGADVDDHVLKPGWSSFDLRLPYQTTDVTTLLTPGRNALGIRLAGGWYTERYHRSQHDRPTWGERPSVALQLLVEHEDGSRRWVATDDRWTTSTGPLRSSSIYLGEHHDATAAQPGWDRPDFDDSDWTPARTTSWPVVPTPRIAPPARAVEELPVRRVHRSPSGATVLDFGQNLVGRLRVRVRAPRGTAITLRHAEVLEDGELSLRPLRTASSTDVFTSAGGDTVYEPEFTFHGFRYATVEGLPGGVDPADITAVVLHSELRRTGWFSCSEPLLERLHENVVWSMRGNFLHLPTDCPQRDERQGWTGDIQVFSPTASTLFDVDGFLASWLTDLRLEQAERGAVPFIVPDVVRTARPPAAAWGDAATVVPWVLHERFADVGLLADQFASMRAWVEQVRAAADDDLVWRRGWQFGDWLDPTSPPEDPGQARVPAEVVATAYFSHSARLLARAATLLGRSEDAARYDTLAEDVRRAWQRSYLQGDRVASDAPTGYALALAFDLVPAEVVPVLGRRLAALVAEDDFRVSTGFVGTPLLCEALSLAGQHETAGRLLLQTECPSWLFPVTRGATTTWERWDSLLPDGSVNPGEMTSFNHYALGAVADWMYRRLAGLQVEAPGWARIRIAPRPVSGLDRAAATVRTPYGPAHAGWVRAADGTVEVHAQVPPNSGAVVQLGDREPFEVGSGSHHWVLPADEAGANGPADTATAPAGSPTGERAAEPVAVPGR